ncbi:hypothetical protein VCHC02C1_3224B, partial [Vibrio cholerae HC-02C1]
RLSLVLCVASPLGGR